TCARWRTTTKEPMVLIHDQSSNLAKDIELWNLLASPAADNLTIGMPNRDSIYPLNVAKTEFRDSKDSLQLQFCDLVAGAMAAAVRRPFGLTHDAEYAGALAVAGIERVSIGGIWPAPEVSPDRLGTRGWTGRPIDAL